MAYIKHLVDLDLNKNQLLNTKLQNLGSHPTVVVGTDEGFVYWNTADDTAYVYTGVGTVWVDLGSDGITNLSYNADVSEGVVTSDSGGNATIPLADGTNAGLFSAAEKSKLSAIEAGAQADQIASEVVSSASGNLTSTNVQSALVELQGDIDDNATSNSGSVTVHSDVTNAGSGAIITSVERTKLNGIEALADVTDTANVTTAGALMDSEVTDLTGIKAVTISTLQVKPSEGAFVNGDKTKLDGIEALADKTDSTNVNAAGAVMNSDTSTSAMNFVIDEDNMSSNSSTKVPTQQSVKAYVNSLVVSSKSYQGGYNASTDSPSLDDGTPVSGIKSGDVYDVTVAGNFFSVSVEVGDSLRATQDSPTSVSHWTIVQANLTSASIKTQYESNSNTNAFTDGEKTKLSSQSNTNSGDEPDASTSTKGIIEIATQSEVNAGTSGNRAVIPSTLRSTLGITSSLSTTLTYSALIGNGSLTSIPVTHAIGNRFVQANVYEVADGMGQVECEIELTSTTVTTFKFNVAPASNALRVVIIG